VNSSKYYFLDSRVWIKAVKKEREGLRIKQKIVGGRGNQN
jgi:hypothetical protein